MNTKPKQIFRRWKTDYNFKTLVNAAGSFFVTAAFALYNAFLWFAYRSVWNGCISVYYILLASCRGIISVTEKRNLKRGEAEVFRRRTFNITSVIFLMMNFALAVPIALMVMNVRPVNMGMIPAISVAAYTTYKVIMASINVKRKKKSANILVREVRTINFIDALVSVLTLQNTLIIVNESKSNGDMFVLSAVSSAAIYLFILAVSVKSIIREKKK